jgi:hypothetical protein
MTDAPMIPAVKDTTDSGGTGAIVVSGGPPVGFDGFDIRRNGAKWLYIIPDPRCRA